MATYLAKTHAPPVMQQKYPNGILLQHTGVRHGKYTWPTCTCTRKPPNTEVKTAGARMHEYQLRERATAMKETNAELPKTCTQNSRKRKRTQDSKPNKKPKTTPSEVQDRNNAAVHKITQNTPEHRPTKARRKARIGKTPTPLEKPDTCTRRNTIRPIQKYASNTARENTNILDHVQSQNPQNNEHTSYSATNKAVLGPAKLVFLAKTNNNGKNLKGKRS